MLTRSTSKIGLIATASAMGLALMLGTPQVRADGRDAAPQTSRVADRGERRAQPARPSVPRGDRSRHTERQRTDNGHTSHTEWTDRDGRTATRDATVTRDPEAGTRTRDVTYTGRNGGVTTVDDVTQRTDNGYTRNTTVTGPNGATGTRHVTVACDKAAGGCTKDVQVNDGENSGN